MWSVHPPHSLARGARTWSTGRLGRGRGRFRRALGPGLPVCQSIRVSFVPRGHCLGSSPPTGPAVAQRVSPRQPQPRRQLHLLSEMVQHGAMRFCRSRGGRDSGTVPVGGQLCTHRMSSSVWRWCRPSGNALWRAGDLGHLPLGEVPRCVLLPPLTLTATGKQNGCHLW